MREYIIKRFHKLTGRMCALTYRRLRFRIQGRETGKSSFQHGHVARRHAANLSTGDFEIAAKIQKI